MCIRHRRPKGPFGGLRGDGSGLRGDSDLGRDIRIDRRCGWVFVGTASRQSAASFVPLQQYCASLREITAATQESERRIRVLESEIVSILPQILDAFLEDCWTALEIFNEVCGDLVGITVLDESRSPAMTAAETLIQAMERLGTCSDKVSGLPGTGMAVSHQCLAENVINLQNRAVDLIGKFAGSS